MKKESSVEDKIKHLEAVQNEYGADLSLLILYLKAKLPSSGVEEQGLFEKKLDEEASKMVGRAEFLMEEDE